MNVSLEDRLRQHYDDRTRDLPARGPGLDDAPLVRIDSAPSVHGRRRGARIAWVGGSIAAATVLAFALLGRGPDDSSTVGSVTTGSSTVDTVAVLAPAELLPDGTDGSDTPVTIAATGPSGWYRLQPDLDIAWYKDPATDSPSMICWRTPAASECVPDVAPGALPLVVPSGGGQTLVVVLWLTGEPTLDVQLSSGGVLTAPVEVDASIGWGVARFALPDGATITVIGDASVAASQSVDVPGATLPAAVGLNETPLTIPAGSELSYWRWFPDLDISERQTADGGTELCWRTPVGTGCIDDSFISPEVGIVPTDGGAILLARPGLIEIVPAPSDPLAAKFEQGPPPTTVSVTLSDGSTVQAPITFGDDFGVGHARVTLAPGLTIVSAVSS